MMLKNLFKLSTLVVLFSLVMSSMAFAQATYFVDATNGLPSNNGLSATQSGVGTGPIESLTTLYATYTINNGDVINIAVGTYTEGGGQFTISENITLNAYKPLNSASTQVIFPNGLDFAQTGTLTITLNGVGSAGPNAADNVEVQSALDLSSGFVSLGTTGALRIASGTTITRTSGTLVGTPTFPSGNFTLVYASPGINGTMTAGPEVPASFGTGTLTNNRGAFEPLIFPSTVPATLTFANNAGAASIDNAGGGDMTINSNVNLTRNSYLDNTGGGNLTINGNVAFPDPGTNGVTPARISMSGAGALEINGNVSFSYRDVNGGNAIETTGGGTLVINGNVSFTKTSSGASDRTATIRETGGGVLEINGTITHTSATISSTAYFVNVNLINDNAGSVSLGSSSATSVLRGTLSNNNANSTLTLNGNLDLTASLAGATTGLNNAGDIVLGGFTLNLAFVINGQTLTITNGGEISGTGVLRYSVSNGSGAGTVNFTGSGDYGNYTVASNHIHTFTGSPTMGAVSLSQGDLRIATGQTMTVNGTFSFTGGALQTVGTAAIDFKSGFSRTVGTYTPNTGLFKFSGGNSQVFAPGANFAVYDLEFASTSGASVTLNQSVIVMNDLDITTGTVELSTYNIRMQGTGTVTNASGYTSSGGGAIVFEGDGAGGSQGTIQGAGLFSNVEINVTGAGAEVALGSNVAISGVLTLRSGNLVYNVVNESLVLNSNLVRPTIRKNTSPTVAGTAHIVDDGGGAGTFTVATNTTYNMLFFGTSNYTIVGGDEEWVPTQLFDLSVETTGGNTVQITAAALTAKGSVSVAKAQTLNLAAQTLTASGDVTHNIFGTVANGTFAVTGKVVTIQGDDSSTPGENKLANLTINPTVATGSDIKINRIYQIAGNLTHLKGTATYTLGKASENANVITNKKVTGALSVSSGNFILGTWVAVGSGGANAVTHNGGVIELGANRLVYEPGAPATYTASGTASYTYSSTSGRVSLTTNNGSLQTSPNSSGGNIQIPNLHVNGNVSVTGNSEVSNVMFHESGTITIQNGITFTFSGTDWNDQGGGAVAVAGTGNLVLASTSNLATDGSYTIGKLTINPGANGVVTVKSITSSLAASTTERTVTATNLVLTSGTVALGMNDIAAVDLTRTSGAITGDAGSADDASNEDGVKRGELVVGGGTFTPGTEFSVANLRISGATTVAGNNNFTVTSFFQFGTGGNVTFGANNALVLGDSAWIIRDDNSTLSKAPVFGTSVNYYYLNANAGNANYSTGNELTSDGALIKNFVYNARGIMSGVDASGQTGSVSLPANKQITVNEMLDLKTGTLLLAANSGTKLTLAENATLARAEGQLDATSGVFPNQVNARLTVSTYNLKYYTVPGTAVNDFTAENLEWAASGVNNVTVALGDVENSVDVRLLVPFNRTIGSLTVATTTENSALHLGDDGGTYGAKTLTVNGAADISNGRVTTEDIGAGTGIGTLQLKGALNLLGGLLGPTGTTVGSYALDEEGLNVSFTGSANQAFTLSGNQTINKLTINQTGTPVPSVNVGGANLTISGELVLNNGLLVVAEPYYVKIPAPLLGNGQGFTRDVVSGGSSHVVGNVAKTLTIGANQATSTEPRSEFPTGSATNYRPVAINFPPAFGQATIPGGYTILVSYKDQNPGGAVALPITDGIAEGIDVVRYPNFYWAIRTLPSSIGPSTYFDLELTAAGFTEFDDVNNVRIIRRHGTVTDVTNQWLLQGTNSNYDNEVSAGVPSVINRGSNAGLRLGGAIFTFGLKSKMSIANAIPDQILVKENGSKIVSLANVFQGQTGTLSYTVQSSNEAVVKPILFPNSSNLALNPIGVGDAVITVIARDNANTDFYVAHFAVEVTSTVGVDETEELPTEYALYQNFPNPFNPTTNIKFALPNESNVTLKIYNILGEEVVTLVNKVMNAGFHTVSFDASKLTSGMYIYRIEAENFVQVKKMLLMK